jgi:hypothetical protein
MKEYSIEEQWQQFIYSGDNRKIAARYVKGKYIEI